MRNTLASKLNSFSERFRAAFIAINFILTERSQMVFHFNLSACCSSLQIEIKNTRKLHAQLVVFLFCNAFMAIFLRAPWSFGSLCVRNGNYSCSFAFVRRPICK